MNAASPIIPICRHIKTNGHKCQSPAVKKSDLCFFHGKLRHTHRRPLETQVLTSYWQESAIEAEGGPADDPDIFAVDRVYPRQNDIQFPPLEDAESVQLATSMLFQAIATGNIHFTRARLLLHTLKIASVNLRVITSTARFNPDISEVPTTIVHTTEGHILAALDRQPAPDATATSLTDPVFNTELAPLPHRSASEPAEHQPSASSLASTEPPADQVDQDLRPNATDLITTEVLAPDAIPAFELSAKSIPIPSVITVLPVTPLGTEFCNHAVENRSFASPWIEKKSFSPVHPSNPLPQIAC